MEGADIACRELLSWNSWQGYNSICIFVYTLKSVTLYEDASS